MARKVFIGGFSSNERCIASVTDDLSNYYDEEVEGIPFRIAAHSPLRVDKLVKGALAITHSAGMVTLRGSAPHEILSVAPPIPISTARLIGRSGIKTFRSAVESLGDSERAQKMAELGARASAEIARYPIANIRMLGAISRFNSLQAGVDATHAGIDTTLAYMDQDAFGFVPSDEAVDNAYSCAAGNRLTVARGIEGHHDEMVLYPTQMIEAINRLRYDETKQ